MWDIGLSWTVPPVPWYSGIGRTVGYRGPSSGGTVESHGPGGVGQGPIARDVIYIFEIPNDHVRQPLLYS